MATVVSSLKHSSRYQDVWRLLCYVRWVVLPWESLVGTLAVGSVVGLLIGIQLLTPPSTFASSPAYLALERLLPEPYLGWLFVGGSAVGMISLRQQWVWGQIRASAVLAGLYVYLAMGLFPATPNGLGWITYAGLGGCLALSVGVRLAAESHAGG